MTPSIVHAATVMVKWLWRSVCTGPSAPSCKRRSPVRFSPSRGIGSAKALFFCRSQFPGITACVFSELQRRSQLPFRRLLAEWLPKMN